MPIPVGRESTWRDALARADRPLVGMWVCSGSTVVAEICAGSGVDWLLIDAEHAPLGLETIAAQLQVAAAYPAAPLVRLPSGDPVLVKQYLDLGAMNLLVPMVESGAQAEGLVRAMRYPPRGIRGVGSALSRASRWSRTQDYLSDADAYVSLTVQIESVDAAGRAKEIASTDGVDAIFIGPSDLAASMGLLGQQDHDDVRALVRQVIADVRSCGKPVGVNAFNPETAQVYLDAGVDFLNAGADVALLARGAEALAVRHRDAQGAVTKTQY